MEYEFIPIVYPNKENDTSIPPPLVATIQTITSEVVPGQGLPYIASAPYVAPPPVPEPTPLPQTGVLVDPAGTLAYRPMTELPATTTFNQTDNYSLPSLITTMGGEQSLYAPYDSAGQASGRDWSLYPALQQVNISSFGITGVGDMSGVGNMEFLPGKTITGVQEIAISDGGFGSLTLNSGGIENAGIITGIDSLELNTQILTAQPTALLLNGVPIATISDLPNIYQWANYPALSNVELNAPGTNGPHQLRGAAIVSFSVNNYLEGLKNPPGPQNPNNSNSRLSMHDAFNDPVEKIIYSTDLTGQYAAPGTYTGVPKWASFSPQQDLDFGGKAITNINTITFNTAIPGLGGASINALNDLNFSLATGLAGQANITGTNNIAFWNPNFPGVPGAYVNLYSKNLTYAAQPASIFLATDTNLAVPAIYTSGIAGTAGGKIECRGANATYVLANGQPCPAVWSQFNAVQAVNLNGNQVLGCRQIDFQNDDIPNPIHNLLSIDNQGYLTYEYPPGNAVRITPPNGWSAFPALQNVNAAGFNITNLGQLQFNFDPNNILSVAGTTLEWRGQPIQTGAPPDNTANWAQYTANANVNIPHNFKLNINGENFTPPFHPYQTSVLNTNIQHGDPGNEFECPDFDSYPVNFTIHNSRAVSLNSTSIEPLISGIGLNAIEEVNIEGGIFCGINTGALEVLGAITTINAATSMLIESPDINITGAAVTANGTGTLILGGSTASLTGLIELTITTAGDLNIFGGVTTIGTGELTAVTGICTWTAPAFNIGGGNINLGGFFTTIESGTLLINTGSATAINSPITQLNSVQTIVAATRTFQADNIAPTTANNLAISGVNTITGRTDTGMVQTEVKSIAGNGSGMDLTNIANFETYSATNVLLPCKTLTANIPSVVLTATAGYTLIYTSPTKIWSWLNIPQLMFSYTFKSDIFSAGSPAGQATPIGIYIVLANLTNPGDANTIVFRTLTGTSTPNNAGDSSITLTDNQSYPNKQAEIAQGNSYAIRVFASSLTATNNSTLTNTTMWFNVINAGAL